MGIEGSSMYLRSGEVLTVQELLYGLMLRLGNDAAVALAHLLRRHRGGICLPDERQGPRPGPNQYPF